MKLRMFFSATATLVLILGLSANLCAPDPCLVVYPSAPCTYHYDPTEYFTVEPGHPLYDPMYDRGGKVLLEIGTNEVDLSIYQAPQLTGFVPALDGNEGYFLEGTNFELIIDGFSNVPTTYVNVLVVFDQFVPEWCAPTIYVNGSLLSDMIYHAGDLVVQTPTPNGNNYSDVLTIDVSWQGCYGVHVWAFSDVNYDNIRDGGECFTAYSHDVATPVEESTWGRIKALYR
jgi:hypothetical protein